MNNIITRSHLLNNIPSKKLEEYLIKINSSQDDIKTKNIKSIAINRYNESNIPVEYWSLNMKDHFIGDQNLLKKYNEYTEDLSKRYQTGESFCLAGIHGTGKTMTVTNILKKAVNKGYTGLYTTLTDIVSVLTQASSEEALIARKELSLVNFLVIDEFDNRFTSSENSSNLYGRTLENVFRTRSSNKQPTLMCTNSPNIIETFSGALKSSIDSLLQGYITMFPVFGKDQRKE